MYIPDTRTADWCGFESRMASQQWRGPGAQVQLSRSHPEKRASDGVRCWVIVGIP